MQTKSIHIIGGGIIGLCSAYFLEKEGFEVTLIDKGNLQDGTSFGNAGMIVPSHFVPLAAPGVISQGIKWMFKSDSPFFIRPRLNSDLIQWLWKFYRSCSVENVNKSMDTLLRYNEMSRDLYGAFAQKEGFEFSFEKKGLLMLFKTEVQKKEEIHHAEEASKLGVKAELLDIKALKKLEPNIQINALGGLYFPDDAHLYPNLFISQMINYLKAKGVKIIKEAKIVKFNSSGKKINSFEDHHGNNYPVQNILFSAGSWTGKVLKKCGVKILLQDGKGYSLTLKNQTWRPEIPTILSEAKVAVTPMGSDLRIGGTLEISGLSTKIHQKRVDGILQAMPRYYPEFHLDSVQTSDIWLGYRPCSPDGLPYLGKLDQFDNAYIATGHGMMGLSLGPATGKLISQLICNKKTDLDLSLFHPNR